MKHKTAELDGALLNAAVAKAEGLPVHPGPGRFMVAAPIETRWAHEFDFCGSWKDGGPIIQRELIELAIVPDEDFPIMWWAFLDSSAFTRKPDAIGPTHLIAAMRAYVASRFGDEVELP